MEKEPAGISADVVEARFVEITEFFAKLASLESLRSLREGERLLLEEDARRLLYSWMGDLTPVVVTRRAPRRELWDERKPTSVSIKGRASAIFLKDVHAIARSWLTPLVDAQQVFPDPDKLPAAIWAVRDGVFLQGWQSDPARRGPEGVLISTFRHRKFFPYGRCATCGKIFAKRVKRQKYCSSNCTYLGSESSRKEKKRAYMKKYMATRRARERRLRAKQRSATSAREKSQ
jgi:hypothetical protein